MHKKKENDIVVTMTKEELTKFCCDCFYRLMATQRNAIDEEMTFFTGKQLEEHFQVSHGTIWNWRREGKLQPVKIGKRVLYRMSDVRKFVIG